MSPAWGGLQWFQIDHKDQFCFGLTSQHEIFNWGTCRQTSLARILGLLYYCHWMPAVAEVPSSEVRCKTLDQEPMIACRYQSRIAPSLTFRQTVTLGRAVVDGRKSATVMPRVAVPVVSTVTGSRCVPKNSGLTA